jgi:hypothetical protein
MDDFFFCVGGIGFFILLFGFIALLRYIGYRENLMLAEKGLVAPPRRSNGGGNAALIWGIMIAAVGMALCIGLFPIGFWVDRSGGTFPMLIGPWLLPGLIPMFFGFGLLLVHVLTREPKEKVVVQETRFTPTPPPSTPVHTATVVEPAPATTTTMTPPATPGEPPAQ